MLRWHTNYKFNFIPSISSSYCACSSSYIHWHFFLLRLSASGLWNREVWYTSTFRTNVPALYSRPSSYTPIKISQLFCPQSSYPRVCTPTTSCHFQKTTTNLPLFSPPVSLSVVFPSSHLCFPARSIFTFLLFPPSYVSSRVCVISFFI
jgi:hypothetical protein